MAGALGLLERAASLAPAAAALRLSRGKVLLDAGRDEEAREAFAAAAGIDPSSYNAHLELGLLEVKRALQDGEQVAVLSHIRQRPGDRGAAVVHIFRFEGGRIVELWDIGQAVPEEAVNENGMF